MSCRHIPLPVLLGTVVLLASSAGAAPDRPASVDAHGDPLPARALARLGTVRLRHGHTVQALAFSADGTRLASGGHDFGASVWDVKTGKELLSIPGPKEGANPFVAGRSVTSVAFSPDGKLLAVGRNDVTLCLYDVATGKEVCRFAGLSGLPVALAFAPDGQALAAAGGQPGIRLWDVATGALVRAIEDRQYAFTALAFSPDGKSLVAGGSAVVRAWDAATGKETLTLQGHRSAVTQVAFSPDGKVIFSAALDGTVRAWDAATGREERKVEGAANVGTNSAAFSPDGKSAALCQAPGNLRLYDLTTGKPRGDAVALPEAATRLAFAPDGKLLASGGSGGAIRLWDAAGGKEVRPVAGHTGGAWSACFADDGRTVLAGYDDRAVRAWDADGGKLLRRFGGVTGGSRLAAFTADGRRTATVSPDGTLRFWDTATGKAERGFDDNYRGAAAVAVSADGTRMALGGPWVVALDVRTGREGWRVAVAGNPVRYLAFSPDAKLLAATSMDGRVRLLDGARGTDRRVLTEAGSVVTLAFSPDGKWLAGGDQGGTTRVWDVASGALLTRVAGNPGYVMSVAFSADGRLLASGSWTSVSVWEVASGKERLRLNGHRGDVGALAFSRDGRRLVSGSSDGTLLVWDLTGRLKDGKLVPGDLTAKEVEAAWADLLTSDAAKAHAAVWSLVGAPKEAVPFLANQLRAAAPADDATIARLIAQLDDDALEVRDEASTELAKLGEAAAPALRQVLDKPPSAEVRLRARQLLDKLKPSAGSPEQLRDARAVEVLEQVGGAEARKVLEALAKGLAGAPLTQQARAALDRLTH